MKQNLYPGPPAAARQKGGPYDDIKRVKKNGKSYREQREGSHCETTNGIWRRSDRKGNSFTGNSNQRVCEWICSLPAGKHYTVFSIEDCGTYGYESVKDAAQIYESSFFDNENWYVRLIMEAEDRLERNQERIKSNHKVCSYDRLVEECGEIGNDEEDILESMAKDDLIKRMMEKLNERQRDIVYLFYFEQWRQQDIADHFGVSQQSVSDMIRRVLKILSEYVHQERNN